MRRKAFSSLLKTKTMKEDLTPIEELTQCYQVAKHYQTWETFLDNLPMVLASLLIKDKAHREKYKHTKEDVIQFGLQYAPFTMKKVDVESDYKEQHEHK